MFGLSQNHKVVHKCLKTVCTIKVQNKNWGFLFKSFKIGNMVKKVIRSKVKSPICSFLVFCLKCNLESS